MSSISALEIACLDIKGQALGVPIYELLGGKVRDRIPAYANGWYTVERTPEEFHKAAKKVLAKGYQALKVRSVRSRTLRTFPRRADPIGIAGRSRAQFGQTESTS
ncbi:MAG: hypothetical protein R2845_13335 [Thermomicrobiales bacterium]